MYVLVFGRYQTGALYEGEILVHNTHDHECMPDKHTQHLIYVNNLDIGTSMTAGLTICMNYPKNCGKSMRRTQLNSKQASTKNRSEEQKMPLVDLRFSGRQAAWVGLELLLQQETSRATPDCYKAESSIALQGAVSVPGKGLFSPAGNVVKKKKNMQVNNSENATVLK